MAGTSASGESRPTGPDTDMAATGAPVWLKIGAATQLSPRDASSLSYDTPRTRIRSSVSRNCTGLVMLYGVSAGRPAAMTDFTTSGELKARMALPTPVQAAGTRPATRDGDRTLRWLTSRSM